jgi:hypothetical protein
MTYLYADAVGSENLPQSGVSFLISQTVVYEIDGNATESAKMRRLREINYAKGTGQGIEIDTPNEMLWWEPHSILYVQIQLDNHHNK